MIEFRTLGTTDLRRDGAELRAVVLQPKRLAVLTYLATAAPRGFQSRERLLGLFWPDLDQERARNAMRQALHFLRRSLGDEVVVGRGDREVGIGEGTLWCDAAAFDDALAAGRLEEAMALYRGDFLPGFCIDDADEAEKWLEAERDRRRHAALDALRTLVDREEARGERRAAVLWARRATALAPTDEGVARRLVAALDRAGEPAAALDAYDQLVHRLREEFGVAPAAETIALVNAIRRRPPASAGSPPAAAVEPAPVVAAPEPARTDREPAAVPRVPPAAPPPPIAEVPAAPPAALTRRRLWSALSGAAAVALFVALWLQRPGAAPAAAADSTIAVLPFLNMSPDSANGYLADGFTEEILNALANQPGLQVAARTSSFRFKGQQVTIDSVARALRVRHVLEGSVRVAGDRMRVTAQLIDAATGYHLWSETFDRSTADIFAVQDEISRAIAVKLRTGVAVDTAAVAPETRDPEAHAMFLRARQLNRMGPKYADSARILLETALARDPGYARARGLLAVWYAYEAYARRVPVESGYARARAEAERSLELRETVEAHLALARIAQVRDWDFQRAERHYARAAALAPSNAGTYGPWALALLRLGRGDEAVAVARRGVALDPLSHALHNAAGAVNAMTGRYDEAIARYRSALALVPDEPAMLSNLAAVQAEAGDSAGALATLAKAEALAPDAHHVRATRAYVEAHIGRRDSAQVHLAALSKDTTLSPVLLASAYAVLGDRERTLAFLERAAAVRDEYLTDLMAVREFAPYRDDPRFVAIRERLGL